MGAYTWQALIGAGRPLIGAGRLVRNILLWVIPAWVAWTLLTPVYNRFLVVAAENLLQISESPNASDLYLRGRHDASTALESNPLSWD